MQPHASPRLQHKLTCNSHHMQTQQTQTLSHMQLSRNSHNIKTHSTLNSLNVTHSILHLSKPQPRPPRPSRAPPRQRVKRKVPRARRATTRYRRRRRRSRYRDFEQINHFPPGIRPLTRMPKQHDGQQKKRILNVDSSPWSHAPVGKSTKKRPFTPVGEREPQEAKWGKLLACPKNPYTFKSGMFSPPVW